MADLHHLHGTCACERNYYQIIIPASSAAQAQVFFDNSAANRRSQAAPVTAWLRVPLDWYRSTTSAQFADETPNSIKRTYYSPSTNPVLPPTRRQFCGYCGTHLTAWNEGLHGRDSVNVTLGSLLNESLDLLEALQVYGDLEQDDEGGVTLEDEAAHLPRDPHPTFHEDNRHIPTTERGIGGTDGPSLPKDPMPTFSEGSHIASNERNVGGVDGPAAVPSLPKDPYPTFSEGSHIATNERSTGGVDGPSLPKDPHPTFSEGSHIATNERSLGGVDAPFEQQNPAILHNMQGRGVPYFEEMIERSRLGRIKRLKGGHVSADGAKRVEWEVLEIGGDDDDEPMADVAAAAGYDANKRVKIDV